MKLKNIYRKAFYLMAIPVVILLSSCGGGGSGGGTSFPVTNISLNIPYNHTITKFGTRVYKFKTLAAGSYTISLTNLASDLGWTLVSYDPSDTDLFDLADNIIDEINGDMYFDLTDEVYTKSLAANTYYYVVVDEWDNVDSSYTLEIFY